MVRFKRMPIQPSFGGGVDFPLAEKSIRLARYGCANRPFYHIVVLMKRRHQHDRPIEQLGVYDPMANEFNEKLVSINIERLRYWIAHRTTISTPVSILLGLCGLYPIHPRVIMYSWRIRRRVLAEANKQGASPAAAQIPGADAS